MYPKDAEGQRRMQLAEIKNGRLAMIAITAFAFQELVTQSGVVDATPSKFDGRIGNAAVPAAVFWGEFYLLVFCFHNFSLLQTYYHCDARIHKLWLLHSAVNACCTMLS